MLNTKIMMINSVAFGLFLMSVFVYYVVQDTLYFLKRPIVNNQIIFAGNMAVDISNTIAQVVLCVMFKNISNDNEQEDSDDEEESPEEDPEEVYPTIEVEEFDEHAELQKQLWNQFFRQPRIRTRSESETSISMMVTSRQIVASRTNSKYRQNTESGDHMTLVSALVLSNDED